MQATVYSKDGKEAGKVTLPESVFGLPWNADLVHQVAVSMQANARANTAHTKGRGDVRGGGKKPWKQKGTGRARHGSSRSPIWVGGGTTHGPTKERVYTSKINKKVRAKALFTVLSRKMKDGEILFVDSLSFGAPKTADAKAALVALAKGAKLPKLVTKRKNAALIAGPADENLKKSFRNIGSVAIEEVRNLNPVDLLNATYLVFANAEQAVATLSGRKPTRKAKPVASK